MPDYKQSTRPVAGLLKLVELMETVQGEGVFAGVPSIFFRTGMCNLECKGCDTKWDTWAETELSECARQIRAFKSSHIVLTGGEPTLWQPGLAALIRLLGSDYTVTIESNGSVPITDSYLLQRVDLWSFSPKVGSLGHDEVFKHDVVLNNLAATRGRSQIKYVLDPYISSHADSVFAFQDRVDFYDNGVSYAVKLIPNERVFFQPYDRTCEVNVLKPVVPMSNEREYLNDLAALTKLVMARSNSRFRVLPQLHKLLVYR